MNLKVGDIDYGKVNVSLNYGACFENCWGHSSYLFPSSIIKNNKSNIYFDCEARRNYEDMNQYLYWGAKTMSMCYENIVSEAKSISVAAYGLLPNEIIIKEVDGKLTVKSTPKVKANVQSNLNLSYTLKNTKLDSVTLALGVLTIDFVDTENVVIHKVNNGG